MSSTKSGFVFQERELFKRMTLTAMVKIEHDWRCTLGLWLMDFGCKIAGIDFDVEKIP